MRLPLLLLAAFSLAACTGSKPAAPLPTVPRVELSRYAGQWYEVARLPTRFQKPEESAVAQYTLQPDGTVRVRNIATKPDGTSRDIEGRAEAVPGSNGARLRVKFEGLAGLAPNPAEGNYWIIALDERDYRYAMVGLPDRKFLWILSRTPQLEPATERRLVARAKELGFATDQLIRPRQR